MNGGRAEESAQGNATDSDGSEAGDAWETLEASFRFVNNGLLNSLGAARAVMKHKGERGQSLEDAVHDGLRDLVPKRYAFGQGEVMNGRGSRSRQQDFVIADTQAVTSLWKSRHHSVMPIEAIAGSIEVKTSLDSKEIAAAVENVRSVKVLADRTEDRAGGPSVPFGGIIGLSTPNSEAAALKAYCEACDRISDPLHKPDALLVLGDAAVMPGIEYAPGALSLRYWSDPKASRQQIIFKGAEASALFFFYRLLEHVTHYVPPALNFLSYARKTEWRYHVYTPDDIEDRAR